jgi:phosphoribosyl 1,2-cyclic phosphodiesterase
LNITLWGTRGSLPNAGPETVRYGGNTSCVEVRGNGGTLLVLDAGTGIRRLGNALSDAPLARIDILLTHLHMDHIVGLGFFAPLYDTEAEVHIWGPPSATMSLRERLARYLSPPLFPVRIRDLPREPFMHDMKPGCLEIGCFRIAAAFVCHPGLTFGYRISENGKTMAYLPDHEPVLCGDVAGGEPEWTSGFGLAAGVDTLIHDAQYTRDEYSEHVGWGHSAIDHTVAFAEAAGVKRLVTFHHDPGHDDSALDRLVEHAHRRCHARCSIIPGTEGLTAEV